MTTLTSSASLPGAALPRRDTIGVGNVIASEWTKLRSLRSSFWTGIVAVVIAIAIAILGAASFVRNFRPGDLEGFDAANFTVQGLYASQILLGALGVLTITGEYATGMIRTSLTSVPQRRSLLVLKGLVYTAVVFVLGEVASFGAFLIGQSILHQKHAGLALTDHNVLRVVVGGGLYVTVVGVLAFGLGALIRRTAGALATFFAVLFLPSALIDLLPSSWRDTAMKYAPANAGTQVLSLHRQHGMLTAWNGLGVLAIYAAIVCAAALFFVGRRDA
ncbi:MAG: ABC transporter permease subunit [Acidothermaceae bacterium]